MIRGWEDVTHRHECNRMEGERVRAREKGRPKRIATAQRVSATNRHKISGLVPTGAPLPPTVDPLVEQGEGWVGDMFHWLSEYYCQLDGDRAA